MIPRSSIDGALHAIRRVPTRVTALTVRAWAAVALLCIGACAGVETSSVVTDPSADAAQHIPTPARVEPQTSGSGQILARNDRYVIYAAAPGDTLQSIAWRFLGSNDLDWTIAEFNHTPRLEGGETLVVPLRSNASGVFADGYQVVPILCYHRFGPTASKMVVTPASFAAQLEYLARNDFRVIRLTQLVEFLEGKRALPKRAVVITVDDGYASVYQTALPLLKRYGFPATVFVYTDFIGARDALTWPQMHELVASGLIDVQAHSKTHTNLTLKKAGENDERYRERLDTELRLPRHIVQQRLSVRVSQFAYPYGDTSDIIVQRLAKAEYTAAVTVNPGGNPFFASSFALRRTMIFGDHDLEAFKAKLQVFREMDLR